MMVNTNILTETKVREKLKKFGINYELESFEWLPGRKSLVNLICPEHGSFERGFRDISSNKGCNCPKCPNRNMTDSKIKEMLKEYNVSYELKSFKWVANKKSIITLICPDHGEFEKDWNTVSCNKQCVCPKCRGSSGERFISKQLKEKGEIFDREVIDEVNGKRVRYDFVVTTDERITIEFDGQQHFISVFIWIKNEKRLRQRDRQVNKNILMTNQIMIRIEEKDTTLLDGALFLANMMRQICKVYPGGVIVFAGKSYKKMIKEMRPFCWRVLKLKPDLTICWRVS